MNKISIPTLAVLVGFLLGQAADAGPMGSRQGCAKRKLHKNPNSVVNPAVNLLPGASNTFSGQFLMPPIPPQPVTPQPLAGSTDPNQNRVAKVHPRVNPALPPIKSGVGKTGHSSRYMNYGGHYAQGARSR